MALIPCRECNKEVSSEAETCPHCGIKRPVLTSADNEKQPVLTNTGDDVQTVKKTLIVVLTLAAVAVVIYLIASMPSAQDRQMDREWNQMMDDNAAKKRQEKKDRGY